MRTLMTSCGLVVTLALCACSHRDIYEGTQAWRAQDCDVQSSRSERDDCRAQARQTYDEHDSKREAALMTQR